MHSGLVGTTSNVEGRPQLLQQALYQELPAKDSNIRLFAEQMQNWPEMINEAWLVMTKADPKTAKKSQKLFSAPAPEPTSDTSSLIQSQRPFVEESHVLSLGAHPTLSQGPIQGPSELVLQQFPQQNAEEAMMQYQKELEQLWNEEK
ncbi:hypothetical protein EWM64_g7455 [Hericium alpestre]|uniref:Uncharacterized protein n=1 Tax=Hericium alpestre TaxID=135208 RepID=A0A4Y9ZSU8_9AGAM|nr:hypothetical protein EWM64_g7455 [Hericium alpestre]